MPLKIICSSPEPQYREHDFIWRQVLADAIELKRYSDPTTVVPSKKKELGTQTHTGKRPCEDTGGHRSDAATSQGSPGTSRSHDEAGRTVPSSLQRERGPNDTLVLNS